MRTDLSPGCLVMLLSGGKSWQKYVGQAHVLRAPCSMAMLLAHGIQERHWFFEPPVITGRTEYSETELGWGETRLLLLAPGEPVEGLQAREPQEA